MSVESLTTEDVWCLILLMLLGNFRFLMLFNYVYIVNCICIQFCIMGVPHEKGVCAPMLVQCRIHLDMPFAAQMALDL